MYLAPFRYKIVEVELHQATILVTIMYYGRVSHRKVRHIHYALADLIPSCYYDS